jgi:nucleotide-binding universal stress UspA family protein
VLANPQLALLTFVLIAIATVGKATGAFTGAFTGAWFGGLRFPQALALAAGMNARGATEIIVASIGLSIGVLSQNLFTMIVAMAFITTIAMPPTLRWALGRLPLEEEERKRLDRDELDAQGLLSQWERILVVVDDSPNGKFAARIAGLLAGPRKMPVTILTATGGKTEGTADVPAGQNGDTAADIVKAASLAATPLDANNVPAPVDVIERQHDTSWEDAVAKEAAKGYDLLIVGVFPAAGPNGGFADHVSRLVQGFPGSLGVVTARGRHRRDPADQNLKILVPVTGSEVSRHGAEFALALAKAAKTGVTAITVIPPGAGTTRQRYSGARDDDAAEVGKEITAVAEAMDQPVSVTRRTDISPEDAILREARRGNHDLILLGVSRRPGDRLSLGELARAMLESSDRSLLFLSF